MKKELKDIELDLIQYMKDNELESLEVGGDRLLMYDPKLKLVKLDINENTSCCRF